MITENHHEVRDLSHHFTIVRHLPALRDRQMLVKDRPARVNELGEDESIARKPRLQDPTHVNESWSAVCCFLLLMTPTRSRHISSDRLKSLGTFSFSLLCPAPI